MKEFKPSEDFVSRVMENVHACEKKSKDIVSLTERLVSSRPIRYALSAGGVLLGIWNLVRLYFTVFAPVVCR